MTSIVEKKQKLNPLPLHNAILEHVMNDDELLELLSRNKQEAKVKDANGNYPLYLACRYCGRSHYWFLLALIKAYPDAINRQQWENGYSNPLHLLCWFDNPNLLSSMLERNPNIINNHDEMNRTPLQIACKKDFKDLVSILLRYPNIHVNNKDLHEETALHCASWKVIPLLLKYDGINVNIGNDLGHTPFLTYINLLQSSGAKYTPKSRKFKIIQLFMKCYPNIIYCIPTLYNGAQNPILHYLIVRSNNEALKYFLACTMTPADVINATDDNGITPFHKAAIYNTVDSLGILLDCPLVDVSKKSNDGRTALHSICYHHHKASFQKVLKCPRICLLIHCIDHLGNTPLHSVFQQIDFNGIEDFEAEPIGNGNFHAYTSTALWFLNKFMRNNECLIFIKNKDGKTVREVIDATLSNMESCPNNRLVTGVIKAKHELLCNACESYEMKARWKLYHYLLTSYFVCPNTASM
jgi:ankyrin repeat protein